MRYVRKLLVVVPLFLSLGLGRAEQSPATLTSERSLQGNSKEYPFLAAVPDPACPVSGLRDPFPHTKELRILYFPKSIHATISSPKALSLHLVFEYGYFDGDRQTLPFTVREDGNWVATVPLEERIPTYAVYWVEEPNTKQSDTNHGKYFDVRFCDVYGERSEMGVKWEALSYTGILTPYGIDRPVDFAKAIDVLEEHIHPPTRGGNLISDVWRYKLQSRGDTPEARTALITEINDFISVHSKDGFGLTDAVDFVAYTTWIPVETTESLLLAAEKNDTDPNYNPRAYFLWIRSSLEKDRKKQAASAREVIARYPKSSESYDARRFLFSISEDVSEREELYRQLSGKYPYDVYLPVDMARTYADDHQKLPDALNLLDHAERILDQTSVRSDDRPYNPPQTIKAHQGTIAVTRAKIFLAMGKPEQAVNILLPRKSEFKQPSSFFLLGEALEGTGNAKGAVDAYIEAATRPWSNQKQANAALETLWRSQKMGSNKDLQRKMEVSVEREFTDAEYVPRLLHHPAPKFDLTTLRGERFTNSQLTGRIVVVNFWAVWCGPCLTELQPLQDFQRKHPDVIVLTVVGDDTDSDQLQKIIRNEKLRNLRISLAPQNFWQQFGALGIPNTFVIDKTGNVRTQHYGGFPDVERYLSADIAAITQSM